MLKGIKREIIYIKEDNWEKDNKEKEKLTKIIKSISQKNFQKLLDWQTENPECLEYESTKSEEFNQMIVETINTDPIKNEKIIKNLAKELCIEKIDC